MILAWGLLVSAYGSFLSMPTGIRSTNQGSLLMIRTISLILIASILFEISTLLYIPDNSICVFMDGTIRMTIENTSMLIFIQLIALIIIQFGIEGGRITGEVYLIMLVNLIAIIYVLIGIDWLVTVVAWELFNLSLYLLVSMQRSKEISLSASVKYFLLSAYTTSFLLLSIALLYGLTGTTSYDGLIMIVQSNEIIMWPFYLMMITFLFKLGAAPLHNWSPDLYDSLPTFITMWMITIPKTTVLFLLSQLNFLFMDAVGSNMLLIFGTLSLLIGSIGLSSQWKIKRFLSYSSISNLGFILLSFNSLSSYYFYIIVYVMSTLIIFGILLSIVSSKGVSPEYITDLSGLYKVNPGLAYALAICLFSLAGCPPLIGFYSKLLVIVNLLDQGYYMILIALILASIISTCNYLSIIQVTHLGNYASQECYKESLVISYRNGIFISAGVGIILIMFMSLSNLMGDLFSTSGILNHS